MDSFSVDLVQDYLSRVPKYDLSKMMLKTRVIP
jgi:hypothetical protein